MIETTGKLRGLSYRDLSLFAIPDRFSPSQIHEEEVPLNTTVANGTFIVDATIGRNLEFRLDTSTYVQSEAPYLISPSGQNYTDAELTRSLNIWIIRVDMAEVRACLCPPKKMLRDKIT